jgi:hypothetical protein
MGAILTFLGSKKPLYDPNWAIVELAADSRQMSSRYSELGAAISNADDGVRSATQRVPPFEGNNRWHSAGTFTNRPSLRKVNRPVWV